MIQLLENERLFLKTIKEHPQLNVMFDNKQFDEMYRLFTNDMPDALEDIIDNDSDFVPQGLLTSIIRKLGEDPFNYVSEIYPYLCCDDDMLTSISIGGSFKVIGECAFNNCENLKSVKLNEGIEVIEYRAFAGCDSLNKLTLPLSLTRIENMVFEGNYELTSIAYSGTVEQFQKIKRFDETFDFAVDIEIVCKDSIFTI